MEKMKSKKIKKFGKTIELTGQPFVLGIDIVNDFVFVEAYFINNDLANKYVQEEGKADLSVILVSYDKNGKTLTSSNLY